MRALTFTITLTLTAALGACGGDETGSPAAASCDSSRKGFLSCGQNASAHTCQPGQYCSDETFGQCTNGCLGDVNCGCGEVCEANPGEAVGTCRKAMIAAPTPTPTPAPTTTPTGCGDRRCTDAELGVCAADCQPLVENCREICRSYDFFSCFGPGELQSCYDKVAAVTAVSKLEQYMNCGGTGGVSCDPCTQYLD